ncbi:MAG: class I SAM-dependent methyltransferase [Planctomycetes bacterium]|nr:class I SAM-dependent methyltransferase [Planctomycetota bacterium]
MAALLELPQAFADIEATVACPLCDATNNHTRFTIEDLEIRNCSDCGFVFALGGAQMVTEEGYYDSMGGYERFLAVKRPEWRRLFRDLARRTNGRRLLEVGCARGYALALAREMAWLPCGVEVSGEDVEFARSRLGLQVHHGTLTDCTFDDASFDVIIMWSVIEHISDPVAALRDCARLLKPSGLLSIATCNVGSAVAQAAGREWSMYNLPGHVSFFTPTTMRYGLNNAGLDIAELTTGLGARPVNVDPKARGRLSVRKVAARLASSLRLKEPMRKVIYKLKPGLRGKGEFMSVIARVRQSPEFGEKPS